MDWNGEVRLSQGFDSFPRVVPRGDNCLITYRIRTLGDWDGEIAIVMALRGRFTRSRVVSLPLHVSRHKDDVPFLRAVPDVQAVLTMDRAFDKSVVLCLGVKNDRASSIEAELNFCVPNYVSELVPADQDGSRRTSPDGSLMTSSDVLIDDTGTEHSDGIRYWQQKNIELAGRGSTVVYFRVTMSSYRPFPVRVTLSSSELVEPIEIRETFDPMTLAQT